MVRKKLAVAVAAMGALQANLALALGMGDFTLNSALNQPLEAEIKLLNIRDLDESQVKITLAGQADFQRAGVSREYFLTNIKFDVVLDQNGGGTIKLTTRDPVIEPYLNFLIEARWPTGRMVREYTVLLDLPVFSQSTPTPVTTARSSLSSQSEATESAPATPATASSVPAMTQASSARQTLTQGSLQAGEKYRVRKNDTLWEIAAQSRPAASVSVQQTMISIQRLNPNAFIKGNINRLKAGYVLRLPTEAEITEISGSEAVREVAVQNRAWRTGDTGSDNTGGAQLDASAGSSDSESGYAEQARLSIATAGDSDTGASGEGSGGSAALRSQLDSAQENLDRAERENDELNGRINDMESKIATLQRLLELKEDQLASLQQQAGEEAPEAPAAMEPGADEMMPEATGESAMMDDASPDMAAEQSAEAVDTGETMESPAAPAPEPVEPQQPAPAPAPAPEPAADPLAEILANPIYLGGAAGAVVLLIAAALFMRKRKGSGEEAEMDELDIGGDDELGDIAFESDDDMGDLEVDVEAESDEVADQLAAELEQEIAGDLATEESAEAEGAPAEAVKSETGDAIAEADIYIAYGRYQQAIDLLSTAVSQEPQRSDLQVKLLEVYIETRDKPAFQQQYMALQALGDDDAVSQVKEMLSSVDGVADWLDDLSGPAEAISDADMDADLIDAGADDIELDLDDELEIDLNLDDLGETQEVPTQAEDELDLDLELSESDDITQAETQALETIADVEEESLSLEDAGEELDLDLSSGEDTLDLGDLDLTGLDEGAEEQAPAMEVAAEEPATEEGFDLDLEADGDLDLDLGELESADLSDLEAEFGDGGADTAAPSPAEPEPTDLGGLDTDLDLGELPEPEEETLSFDAVDSIGLDTEFDLSGEAEAEPEQSFEAPAPEPAPEPEPEAPAMDESFAESVSGGAAESDEFDFLADTDEVATKLDLARAYIDMGDTEGAKDILDEVLQEGNDQQKQEANTLMERV